jgi:hypothetical protein
VFRNMVILYGEELLAPHPTPKLEHHPLSAVNSTSAPAIWRGITLPLVSGVTSNENLYQYFCHAVNSCALILLTCSSGVFTLLSNVVK